MNNKLIIGDVKRGIPLVIITDRYSCPCQDNWKTVIFRLLQSNNAVVDRHIFVVTGWAVAQTCCISQWPKYRKSGNFDHPWEPIP